MATLTDDLTGYADALNQVTGDPALDASQRVAQLRRIRADITATNADPDQVQVLLGHADMYIDSNEREREADAITAALDPAAAREDADIRDRLIADGTITPEQADQLGWPSHADLDAEDADGTIAEATLHAFDPTEHPRGRGGLFADKGVAVGITPFRGKGHARDDAYYSTARYKGFERATASVAREEGVEVQHVERVRGVWAGGGEPSSQVVLCCDIDASLRAADRLAAAYNQDGALYFHPGDGPSVRYVSDTPVDRAAVEHALGAHGLPAATFRTDGRVEIVDLDGTASTRITGLVNDVGVGFGYEHGQAGLRLRGDDYQPDPHAAWPRRAPAAPPALREGQDATEGDPGDVHRPDRLDLTDDQQAALRVIAEGAAYAVGKPTSDTEVHMTVFRDLRKLGLAQVDARRSKRTKGKKQKRIERFAATLTGRGRNHVAGRGGEG